MVMFSRQKSKHVKTLSSRMLILGWSTRGARTAVSSNCGIHIWGRGTGFLRIWDWNAPNLLDLTFKQFKEPRIEDLTWWNDVSRFVSPRDMIIFYHFVKSWKAERSASPAGSPHPDLLSLARPVQSFGQQCCRRASHRETLRAGQQQHQHRRCMTTTKGISPMWPKNAKDLI